MNDISPEDSLLSSYSDNTQYPTEPDVYVKQPIDTYNSTGSAETMEEKIRRLQLQAQRKINKFHAKELEQNKQYRYGNEEPLQYNSDGTLETDSTAELYAKSLLNKAINAADWVLEATENVADFGQGKWLDNADIKAVIEGKDYSMRNKDFIGARNTSLEELQRQFAEAKDDPIAEGVVYQFRKYIGDDDNGNPQYIYKVGSAKDTAYKRYSSHGQNITDNGWELIGEKHFAGAKEWEEKFNALPEVLKAKFMSESPLMINGKYVSRDQATGLNFGSGASEVLTKDLLGQFRGVSEEQALQNYEQSKQMQDWYDQHSKGSANPLRAIGSGALMLGASVGDWILDALTPGNNDLLDKYKSEEWADSVTGYNRLYAQRKLAEAKGKLANGDIIEGLELLAPAGVNLFAESVPMMTLMVAPIPGSRALAGATMVARAANAAKAAGVAERAMAPIMRSAVKEAAIKTGVDPAKILAAYSKNKNSMIGLNNLAHIAKNAGFYTNWAAYTNDRLDELLENRKKAGDNREISYGDILRVGAIQLPSLAIDRMAFKDIVLGKGFASDAINKALRAKDKFISGRMTGALLGAGAKFAKSAGEEGVQEFIQQYGDILSTNLGVSGNTLKSILSNPDNLDEALIAALGGAAAGGVAHTAFSAPRTIGSAWNKATGKDKLDRSFRAAVNASSINDIGSEDIYPHDAEMVFASHFIEPNADSEAWKIKDFSFDNPDSFNNMLDAIVRKRIDIRENASPEEQIGYEETKKAALAKIIDTAFKKSVEVARETNSEEPLNNLSTNIAKIIANPNINVTADDIAEVFAGDVSNDISSIFSNIAENMVSTTDENGNRTMQLDENAIKEKIDSALNKINLYSDTIDRIQGSTINVGGTDVNVKDEILKSAGNITLRQLKDILERYRSGAKTIDDVGSEIANLGLIQEEGGEFGAGTTYVKWKPSINHFARDLIRSFAEPLRLKNIIDPKVESAKYTGIGSFMNFAKSRYEKLLPYVSRSGVPIHREVSPYLMSKIEAENSQMRNLANRLNAMLAVAKTSKNELTEEKKAEIKQRLDTISKYLDESDSKISEYKNALVPYIENILGIKFNVSNPLANEDVRKLIVGHKIVSTIDPKTNEIKFVPATEFTNKTYSTEQNLGYQRRHLVANGFATETGNMNFDAVNETNIAPKNTGFTKTNKQNINKSNEKLNALKKQLTAVNNAIAESIANKTEQNETLLKKKADIEAELSKLTGSTNNNTPQNNGAEKTTENNTYDKYEKLKQLRDMASAREISATEYLVESLKELRNLINEDSQQGIDKEVKAFAKNLGNYIASVENNLSKSVQELKDLQREHKEYLRLKKLNKLIEFSKNAWNKIRKYVKKLLAFKYGAQEVRDRLEAIIGKDIPHQIEELDALIKLSVALAKDLDLIESGSRKEKIQTSAANEAIKEYKRILRRKNPKDKNKNTAGKKESRKHEQKNKQKHEPKREEPANEQYTEFHSKQDTSNIEPVELKDNTYSDATINDIEESNEFEVDGSMSKNKLIEITDKMFKNIIDQIDEYNKGC